MRILMILFLSLCIGLTLTLLPLENMLLLIVGCVLVVLGIIFLIFCRKQELRLTLIFCGLGLGLLLGLRYDTFVASPALNHAGTTVTVTGEATDYSITTNYGIQVEARLFLDDITPKATVWMTAEESLKPGDLFSATLRLVDSNQDGSYYSYSEGIFLLGYGRGEPVITPCDSIPFKYLPKVIAHKMDHALMEAFPEDTFGFAAALATGNRRYLSDITKANLKASGIYHALALSGMHISILIGMIGLLVLKKKRLKAILGIPLIWFFTIITGACPSMIRAAVMQTLLLSANLFHRERDIPTSMFLALVVLLLENPWSILGWGLQLSFLSIAGIELFASRLQDYLMGKQKSGHKLLKKLRKLIAASISATFSAMVMTMPLMAVYFGFISLISPVTNLLTASVISICFGGSLITALLGLVCPPVAAVMGWVLSWGFRYVDLIAQTLARIPFGQLYTRNFYGIVWLILLYFIIYLLISKKNTRRIIPICCAVCGFMFCMLFVILEGLNPTFTALDVGQGQCLILRNGGGSTVMIDCGGNNGNPGNLAAEYLASLGETELDLLIITHYDEDHVGGIPQLMQRIHVSSIALPDLDHDNKDEIVRIANLTDTELHYITCDTLVHFGDNHIKIFSPLGTGDSNESGLSILSEFGNKKVLVTGDMESLTEIRLLALKDIPDIDVLIAGHHGSKDSTSAALLEQTNPEQVIISVGDNSYGHPTNETLKRIEAIGAQILRTDLDGTITIKGD